LTLNLTLFLVEGGSSFGTTDFFFLTMIDFLTGAMLSLTIDFLSQWHLQPIPATLFELLHLENAATMP
jgi:hypothetical protein